MTPTTGRGIWDWIGYAGVLPLYAQVRRQIPATLQLAQVPKNPT